MNIGSKIILLRKEKGWSQNDLAQRVEVSREIISRYERNDVMPSVEVAKKIADAFGVSLDNLVGEGQNAQFDKKTLIRMQEIESMNPDFKSHIFAIVDSVIRDYKTQQSYKTI